MVRKFALLAAAALLALPAAASAQDKMARPGHHGGSHGGGGHGGGGHRPNPGGGHRPNPGHGGGHHGGHRPTPLPGPVPGHGHRPNHGHHRPPVVIRPPHHGGWNGHRPGHHWGQYRYPHGHGHYRRWHAGLILPSMFLAQHYWFNDWHRYGVYAPPHPYRWVRYGPDLLLVDTRNGHIRDVRYGFFR